MMRVILISDHRRWHADLARTAASIPTIEEETESQLLREEENLCKIAPFTLHPSQIQKKKKLKKKKKKKKKEK